MSTPVDFPGGGYRYVPAVFQYSAGVAALPGFAIERVRFARVPDLASGFAAIAAHLHARGRPLTALCGCELRSPAPFTEDGFLAFNREYASTLAAWGIVRDDANPVARTNVCPVFEPPAQPGFFAFSYTVPCDSESPTDFVIAGGGEAPEGHANYRDVIVRLGDTSAEGLRDKVGFVVDEMARRLRALGLSWRDPLATQAYTAHDIGAQLPQRIVPAGAARGGLTWHYARPPIVGLEFEMDARRVTRELVLD